MENLQSTLLALLARYREKFPEEAEVIGRFEEFAISGEQLQGRSNPKRHITASTWIFDRKNQKVLLTHHAKLGIWVQLGGHTDEGEDWSHAALREATEESGIDGLCLASPELFDLDIHEIPARKNEEKHLHYDLRFLIECDSASVVKISDESHDLSWIELEKLGDFTEEVSQHRMKNKSLVENT